MQSCRLRPGVLSRLCPGIGRVSGFFWLLPYAIYIFSGLDGLGCGELMELPKICNEGFGSHHQGRYHVEKKQQRGKDPCAQLHAIIPLKCSL